MWFQAAVGQDVRDGCLGLLEGSADQKRAVAIQRLLFGTHQGHAILFGAGKDALNSGLEKFSRRQSLVLDFAGFVTGGIVGARAQFLAKKDVGDMVLGEPRRQPVLVELGVPSAVGARADVRNGSDAVCGQKAYEFFDRVIRVAYRVERRHTTILP